MTDQDIVKLYWDRDESSIARSSDRYGQYCRSIALNILGSEQDAEECVNDTWIRAWDSIPPERPQSLMSFLGRLTRNRAIDMLRKRSAAKRGSDEVAAVLEEIQEFVPGNVSVEDTAESRELIGAVNRFLEGLPAKKRILFVRRVWYADPVDKIADRLGMSESGVSVALSRIRGKLRDYLMEKGYEI